MNENEVVKGLGAVFKRREATLHVIKPEYAYLQIGKYRFYFHGSSKKPIKRQHITLMNDNEVNKTILPYDGSEIVVEVPALTEVVMDA